MSMSSQLEVKQPSIGSFFPVMGLSLSAILFGVQLRQLTAADAVIVTPGSTTVNTITVNGLSRGFRLHVPLGGSVSARPLVLCLHGGGSTAAEQEGLTGFSVTSESVGCVVAYPEGLADPATGKQNFNDGRINTSSYAYLQQVDDVAYIAALIDAIAAVTPIDRTRVFSCGLSNGGLMSQRLGLQLSERIAAIGPVAANIADQLVPPIAPVAAPAMPVAVCQMSGTADAFMPYAGGTVSYNGTPVPSLGVVIGAEATIDFWVNANHCAPTPTITAAWGPTPDATDGCTVERRDYAAGNPGADVTLLKIAGGGHTWAGSAKNPSLLGPVCNDFQATDTLWTFFVAHPKTGPVLVREPTVLATLTPSVFALSVAAVDDGGAAGLTYTWTVISPSGASAPVSANGTSTAADAQATCTETGAWKASVEVKDATGAAFTRSVSFTVSAATSATSATSTTASSSTAASTPEASSDSKRCGAGSLGALALLCGWLITVRSIPSRSSTSR